MKLSLFNSLTRKREDFTPIDANLIKMYVCGPTVYDHPHIGNARSVVVYDVLYRLLINLYGIKHVLYVRNITDIDDKIMIRAQEENIAISELTERTTKYFHNDMNYLGCLKPNIEPKATEHLQEMIDIISTLVDKGIAYEINNHVYFDITQAKNYTKLSGRSLDDMLKGTRVTNSSDKKNSGDFVLWKPSKANDDESTKFDSPFGAGRPGWHIECSAMSHKYLGKNFDIHGGGADLIFPHHTNEIAQSCSAFPGSKFATTWVHNGFLTVNHEKMSKSLGNFTTVQNLINAGVNGEVARLFLLSNHYRKPIDYNKKAIADAGKIISYWYGALENIDAQIVDLPEVFINSLLDDLNTSKAIKIINDFAKLVHSSANQTAANHLLSCSRFLGLMQSSTKKWFQSVDNVAQIEQLIAERKEAKSLKNWLMADQIREKLSDMGISIEDIADGSTKWKKKN